MSKDEAGGADVMRYVNGARLNATLRELAQFGRRDDGGVAREALTLPSAHARNFLIEKAKSYGCQVYIDPIANIYFRREGRENRPAVLTGSHIDTQPMGGRLDGAYGVVAALEVLAALHDANVTTRSPIEAVAWTNEEGSRFMPGSMGSSVFVHPDLLSSYLDVRDIEGKRFESELIALLQQVKGAKKIKKHEPVSSYIELHIEQGPVLEGLKNPLGVVSGIYGVHWYEVTCIGEAGHAGTMPMGQRRDALVEAMNLVRRLHDMSGEDKPVLRITFGKWQVIPNSINTIPMSVKFTVDARSPSSNKLQELDDAMKALTSQINAGCGIEVKRLLEQAPVTFSADIVDKVQSSCDDVSHWHKIKNKSIKIGSGAFHDAMHLTNVCPTGMIFVPSIGGISHNPAESTKPEHLIMGTEALAHVITNIANTV